jgi:hypothetical protein
MFGYACRETPELMPAPICAHPILKVTSEARRSGETRALGSDAKSQETSRYETGKPVTAGVGDPSCALVIAWTFLDPASREHFRSAAELGPGNAPEAGALEGPDPFGRIRDTNLIEAATARQVIRDVLDDHSRPPESELAFLAPAVGVGSVGREAPEKPHGPTYHRCGRLAAFELVPMARTRGGGRCSRTASRRQMAREKPLDLAVVQAWLAASEERDRFHALGTMIGEPRRLGRMQAGDTTHKRSMLGDTQSAPVDVRWPGRPVAPPVGQLWHQTGTAGSCVIHFVRQKLW